MKRINMEHSESVHKSVLLKEAIEGLNLENKKNPVMIDGTFGGGGHSREICRRYKNVKIIAIDQDETAIDRAKKEFKNLNCNVVFKVMNFRDLGSKNLKDFGAFALGDLGQGTHDALNLSNFSVDGILLDLGLSSDQLENSGRGFSFQKDEPLLMTMKKNPEENELTAYEIVNTWEEKNLADIIYGYGGERYARRIAKKIVGGRKIAKISTTGELVEVIASAVPMPYRKGKIHFATRTFQAIRIAVNDELRVLQEGLQNGFKILKNGGRFSIITFHSLEDRIVKNFYKEKDKEKKAKIINKKVITASSTELKENLRSRSAKLRILEKI